ncbi:hypothetical protein SAMN06265374_4486 [Roseibium denhamense]|uniref:Uncharacterized protein n=1 Tax=Roseibium denhamense TaxID=76305 RepID=A0ABY1PN51_9HYPH|nr:hypothetical protein SAMN06265374_4486 [Roseibium denhamense]
MTSKPLMSCRRTPTFESAHRPDQLFQLAVIGLNDIVQILDLAMSSVLWAFAICAQRGNGHALCENLIGIDRTGLFPVFQPSQDFAQEPLGCLGITGCREIEFHGVAEFFHGPVEIGPFFLGP